MPNGSLTTIRTLYQQLARLPWTDKRESAKPRRTSRAYDTLVAQIRAEVEARKQIVGADEWVPVAKLGTPWTSRRS